LAFNLLVEDWRVRKDEEGKKGGERNRKEEEKAATGKQENAGALSRGRGKRRTTLVVESERVGRARGREVGKILKKEQRTG